MVVRDAVGRIPLTQQNNTARKGFTFIEIMAVMAIIALVAAVIIPRLRRRPLAVRKELLRNLNALTRTGQLNAIMTGRPHRILFDFEKRVIVLESTDGKRDSQGSLRFEPVSVPYTKTTVEFPLFAEMQRFFVGDIDMLARPDIAFTSAWFYVAPSGLAQQVKLDVLDTEKDNPFSLVINPFTARFRLG